jgi:hypothetical protein
MTGLEKDGDPVLVSRNITYHYFHGLGARKEGNDVHSFDTEEKTFEALGNAGFLAFCRSATLDFKPLTPNVKPLNPDKWVFFFKRVSLGFKG